MKQTGPRFWKDFIGKKYVTLSTCTMCFKCSEKNAEDSQFQKVAIN